MQDPLQHAREFATEWRAAKGLDAQGGVVIVLDGYFVGWLVELPPAAEWAPGCLAVTEASQVYLVRPAGFRGEVEWLDLGTPEPSSESSAEGSPKGPLPS